VQNEQFLWEPDTHIAGKEIVWHHNSTQLRFHLSHFNFVLSLTLVLRGLHLPLYIYIREMLFISDRVTKRLYE
jgi:hypothetical protein